MSKKKDQEQAEKIIAGMSKAKKIIRLHYHPEAIKKNIANIKEMAEDKESKYLFEDIETLVAWALEKLPLVPPQKEEESVKN